MSTTLGGFLAGGIAACGAVTVTHGFETVKTRFFAPGFPVLKICAHTKSAIGCSCRASFRRRLKQRGSTLVSFRA